MRHSLYWDDFSRRVNETVETLNAGHRPPVRRVAVFITERCNFRCEYCNASASGKTLSRENFNRIIREYGKDAIIHVTGGEPSVVPWFYDWVREHGKNYQIHLNTNVYITPPADSLKRIKVSLDSHNAEYWNALVNRSDAFDRVVDNIKYASKRAVTTITCTLNHENFRDVVPFIQFCQRTFPDLYAIFFSIYKGTNERFMITNSDANEIFDEYVPIMLRILDNESASLLHETVDEKRRLTQGVRFEMNESSGRCYLSMSERVVDPSGFQYTCSHLYRDGIKMMSPMKHPKCQYGCNRRLCAFNEEVEKRL